MKFEFTTEELERLTAFADGRGSCFYEWDKQLLQKLQDYISQAEAIMTWDQPFKIIWIRGKKHMLLEELYLI